MVGLTNNRSIQDEKLIEAVFQSHYSPESRASAAPVYGATATNLIIDARPTTNAMANVAKGAGTENMDYYKEGKKAYLGIDNIHVMRESLNKVVEALREADALAYDVSGGEPDKMATLSSALLNRQALRRSGWLRHLSAIMDGTLLIVRNIHINSSHVLIHCSDGWDRTAQLSSLAQLCLDPFYRTIKGFQILIEKDWLSFGHRFLDRCGHLSSEKFFITATDVSSGGGTEAAHAFLTSVQNKLGGQGHLKETSPVFHQFLECVRQIQRQYPDRFEFNSRFLEQVHYHLYSCQFGTFLFNCERERKTGDHSAPPCERTVSIWDFLNSPPESEKNINPSFDPTLDDPSRRDPKADMGVLFPNPKDVRFWNELYGRTDDEMNGKVVPTAETQGVDMFGPLEGSEDDPIQFTSARTNNMTTSLSTPSPTSPALSRSLPPSAVGQTGNADNLAGDRMGRSPSPSTALATSMPELTQQRLSPSRQDSFRPFGLGSSSFTLRPRSPNQSSSESGNGSGLSNDLFSPRLRLGLKQTEVLQGGVRSMWGKLSSNASAAFTAVQGAYDGVTKEFRGMSLAGQDWDGQRAPGGEMVSRDRPPAWDSEADWTTATLSSRASTLPSSRSNDLTSLSDRWKSEESKPGLSALTLENPWGTERPPKGGRSSPRRADDLFSTSSVWVSERSRSTSPLPLDPTVMTGQPISRSPSRVVTHISHINTPSALTDALDPSVAHSASQLEKPGTSPASVVSPQLTDRDIDPLGVGGF